MQFATVWKLMVKPIFLRKINSDNWYRYGTMAGPIFLTIINSDNWYRFKLKCCKIVRIWLQMWLICITNILKCRKCLEIDHHQVQGRWLLFKRELLRPKSEWLFLPSLWEPVVLSFIPKNVDVRFSLLEECLKNFSFRVCTVQLSRNLTNILQLLEAL